jgi:hypothetical protein
MNTAFSRSKPGAWLSPSVLRIALGLLLGLLALGARAQEDPPGRVGRLVDLQGPVSWFDREQGVWASAQRNLPLTQGDRISTAEGARSEVRIGSTTLLLAGRTEIELRQLDDEFISIELHRGSLALQVRSPEVAAELDLVTREVRLLPSGPGLFRVDRQGEVTKAGAWRGELRIDDPAGFVVPVGQRVELFREPRSDALRYGLGGMPADAFADLVLREARREEERDARSVSAPFVSIEMTGYEDLDRAGRWEQHPEFGAVWFPLQVSVGWVPYRDGHWAWVRPWGWTWVDNAPWGFAPFHYGRWLQWGGRWAWSPGAYDARPVYAPALVAWAGRPGERLTYSRGGPGLGWQPLAPREVFAPHYRATPAQQERLNPRLPSIGAPAREMPRFRGERDFRDGRDGRDRRDERRDDRRDAPAAPQRPDRSAEPSPSRGSREDRGAPAATSPGPAPAPRPAPAVPPSPPVAAPAPAAPPAARPAERERERERPREAVKERETRRAEPTPAKAAPEGRELLR